MEFGALQLKAGIKILPSRNREEWEKNLCRAENLEGENLGRLQEGVMGISKFQDYVKYEQIWLFAWCLGKKVSFLGLFLKTGKPLLGALKCFFLKIILKSG